MSHSVKFSNMVRQMRTPTPATTRRTLAITPLHPSILCQEKMKGTYQTPPKSLTTHIPHPAEQRPDRPANFAESTSTGAKVASALQLQIGNLD